MFLYTPGEEKDERLAREIHRKLNLDDTLTGASASSPFSSTGASASSTAGASASSSAGAAAESDEQMARRLQEQLNRGN